MNNEEANTSECEGSPPEDPGCMPSCRNKVRCLRIRFSSVSVAVDGICYLASSPLFPLGGSFFLLPFQRRHNWSGPRNWMTLKSTI